MKKRILSILLLCCMVLTMLPTTAFAASEITEQFNLDPGSKYYFDLSAAGIPGTANDALPDTLLHYVPFTYAGTVDAYKLTSEMATTEEYAQKNKYAHSLFMADYAVTHTISWDGLNDADLIFGKNYAAGGVDYTLRAPSVGSKSTDSGDLERGTPQSNEWDRILDKNDGYIKNWGGMFSWGQDTSSSSKTIRVIRGSYSVRGWSGNYPAKSYSYLGFRPVLEVLNPGTLGSDGLKAVTLDLGGGKLGNSSEDIQIIVKTGGAFTAPSGDGLTRPDGDTGSYFKWLGSDGELYAPGNSIPAVVTKLTAQFNLPEQFTLTPGGTYYFDLSGVSIPGTVNGSLPDASLHYVPFTYAGTVDAYKLTSALAITEEDAEQNKYLHSLFVADYAVTHTVNWNTLNDASLIFGKSYTVGGVDYTLRAPSVGSGSTGSGSSQRGTPQSNEWDRILDKNDGYIPNWNEIYSWGQDTNRGSEVTRVHRGYKSARHRNISTGTSFNSELGFRPALEVLNPGTLGSDRLKAVTLDLGGGKLGNSSEDIQIIVKRGESFTAPASDGLTRPDGNTGSYFKWLGSDGKLYVPGGSVPANVNNLTAQFDYIEQFDLDPGGTYYFDLSAMGIPGTVNDALPDKTMHYVPFTYAGTVDAYKLMSEMAITEEYAAQNKYVHSLFMADYAVTHTISWNDLNTADLIFGNSYAAGGMNYTLRAPSVGSDSTGSGDLERGTPQSNEWDKTLDKYDGYIKNWSRMHSWGQDTDSILPSYRAVRGYDSARYWYRYDATYSYPYVGFRPVLEVLNPGTLGSDGLKSVTLDLGGGKLGGSAKDIQIIVKNGESFTAPASDGLTRPDGNTGSYFMWRGSDGNLYAPGKSVPADVIKLTAQFDEQFDLDPGGTYYFDLSGVNIPGTANGSLPDASLHYVPFTYAGTVDAYKLTSALAITEEDAEQNKYLHSLFVADYTVTHTISWNDLNTAGLIFGKDYAGGGVNYTLRAPSAGSSSTGSSFSIHGVPQSNEWDRILDKDERYVQNIVGLYSWGQDTPSASASQRVGRGYYPLRGWSRGEASSRQDIIGFRPVLEVLNPGSLGSDGLKAITLDLGGGKLGSSAKDIQIIVKNGESFTAPASDGLTRPDENTDSYFKWLGSDGNLYAPGDNVPADVTKLTAQFDSSSHSVTITTDTLPDGKVGEAYSQTLTATGTTPITWNISGGDLPDGLTLNETIGKISGTPTTAGTSTFTVKATNSAGSDTKELSITITKDAPAEYTVRFNANGGGGTMADVTGVSGSYTLPACGFTEPEGKQFKGWSTSADGSVISGTTYEVSSDTTFYAIWESKEYSIIVTDGKATIGAGSEISKAAQGTTITLTANAAPDGKVFDKWVVESGSATLEDANSETTTFRMPDSEVSVKATYKNAPVTTYSLTTQVNGGHGTISASKTGLTEGSTETVIFNPDDGYEIDIVTVNGVATDVLSNILNVTMDADKTVIVTYKAIPHTHTYDQEIQKPETLKSAADCTNDAVYFKSCSCGEISTTETFTAAGTQLGHAWASDWSKDTDNHWKECSHCHEKKDEAAHDYGSDNICDTCGYDKTVPHTHNLTLVPAKAPTCTEKGNTAYYTCDGCDKWFEDATGASEITDKTSVILAATGHSVSDWKSDNTDHRKECTVVGCGVIIEGSKAAHTAGEWIIDTPATATTSGSKHKECAVCGYTMTAETIPATGGGEHTHSYGSEWKYDSTNHWHECSCGDKADKAAHVYTDDADTTCDVCGYERTVTPPAPTEFTITFDVNGGTTSVSSMTTTNQKLTSLPSASRSGSYSFDGWYTEKSGGTKITKDTVFHANTTVYAHWTYTGSGGGGGGYNPPVTYYTLRFETGGGSDIPSVRETYNTYIDLTKYVPTWRGHAFIGWYSERGLINKVSGVYLTKDMTVYAGWRVDENPGTGANPFTDVSEKDWFYSDVMFVYENGLMLGTSKTLFSPHGTATRGMMATVLWRMEGSPAPKGKNSFADVETGKWYADAITWTAENGIFAGYGKDKFGPDDPITREQLAVIFYRYADYKGYDLTVKGNLDKFKDADKITYYAKTAMGWAVGSGLVKGKSGNLLDPQGTATRAEIAAMLHRFIEKYELVQGKAPGGLMGWIDPKRLQIPKTGDSSVLGLWGISLCTSLAGCLALTTWQIRRRREEESLQIIEK